LSDTRQESDNVAEISSPAASQYRKIVERPDPLGAYSTPQTFKLMAKGLAAPPKIPTTAIGPSDLSMRGNLLHGSRGWTPLTGL